VQILAIWSEFAQCVCFSHLHIQAASDSLRVDHEFSENGGAGLGYAPTYRICDGLALAMPYYIGQIQALDAQPI
jgi:hypothetical protein